VLVFVQSVRVLSTLPTCDYDDNYNNNKTNDINGTTPKETTSFFLYARWKNEVKATKISLFIGSIYFMYVYVHTHTHTHTTRQYSTTQSSNKWEDFLKKFQMAVPQQILNSVTALNSG